MATTNEQHLKTNNIQLPEDALVRSVHGTGWTFEQFDEILGIGQRAQYPVTARTVWTCLNMQICWCFKSADSGVSFGRISTHFIPIDSSWRALQLCFWVKVHVTKRLAAKKLKLTLSWWRHLLLSYFDTHLWLNASFDRIRLKRLKIKHEKSYRFIYNFITFACNEAANSIKFAPVWIWYLSRSGVSRPHQMLAYEMKKMWSAEYCSSPGSRFSAPCSAVNVL